MGLRFGIRDSDVSSDFRHSTGEGVSPWAHGGKGEHRSAVGGSAESQSSIYREVDFGLPLSESLGEGDPFLKCRFLGATPEPLSQNI